MKERVRGYKKAMSDAGKKKSDKCSLSEAGLS